MQATFAQDVYKTALVALEKGRIEATRTIKKMSVVQTPSLPDHAEKPRRIYNSLLYIIIAMLIAGMGPLLVAIIRAPKDRSDERRVGNECVSTWRSGWKTSHEKQNEPFIEIQSE